MRKIGIILTLLLAFCATVFAQKPATSTPPTQTSSFTVQAAAGTGSVVCFSGFTCTPYHGTVSVTAGTGAAGNGYVVKISWPTPLSTIPDCVFGGWVGNTGNGSFYAGNSTQISTTTAFYVYYSSALASGNTITFTYVCSAQ